MRGGARAGAGRKGIGGWRAVSAAMPRDLYEALEKAQKPGESIADALRACVRLALISNDSGSPLQREPDRKDQMSKGSAERALQPAP